MKRMIALSLAAAMLALPALADQKLTVRPNGSVRIAASASEVTRISVSGDRIRRIVKDESQFQEMNDDSTGDVFLRFAGALDKLRPETGYIITERGVTFGYELTPRQNLGAETVIVTVNGVPDSPAAVAAAAGASAGKATPSFELAAGEGEGGGGYASTLVALTRATIDRHIAGKAPPARGHGTGIATLSANGMRARVLVAAGGRSGRYVRPQDFFTGRVLAVWVERNDLGPNQRAWVVVLEKG